MNAPQCLNQQSDGLFVTHSRVEPVKMHSHIIFAGLMVAFIAHGCGLKVDFAESQDQEAGSEDDSYDPIPEALFDADQIEVLRNRQETLGYWRLTPEEFDATVKQMQAEAQARNGYNLGPNNPLLYSALYNDGVEIGGATNVSTCLSTDWLAMRLAGKFRDDFRLTEWISQVVVDCTEAPLFSILAINARTEIDADNVDLGAGRHKGPESSTLQHLVTMCFETLWVKVVDEYATANSLDPESLWLSSKVHPTNGPRYNGESWTFWKNSYNDPVNLPNLAYAEEVNTWAKFKDLANYHYNAGCPANPLCLMCSVLPSTTTTTLPVTSSTTLLPTSTTLPLSSSTTTMPIPTTSIGLSSTTTAMQVTTMPVASSTTTTTMAGFSPLSTATATPP